MIGAAIWTLHMRIVLITRQLKQDEEVEDPEGMPNTPIVSTASNSQTGGYATESLGVGETASEMTTTGLFMPIQKHYKTMPKSFAKADDKIAQVPFPWFLNQIIAA